MSGQVNSHIQMPKLVLKRFHNEKNELFYYDFHEDKIKKGHAKSLYTEVGYYSAYVEDFLEQKIETPLGELVKFIEGTEFAPGEEPTINYRETAFNYLYSLLSRAPRMIDVINKNSIFFQFMSKTDQHDIVAHDSLIMAKEKNLFGEYTVAFLRNKSSEQLVLPTGGVVQQGRVLICPVSPYDAIVFDKIDVNINNDDSNKNWIAVYEIMSEEEIHMINLAAVEQERQRNHKYIVATSRELLEKILNVTNTFHNMWIRNNIKEVYENEKRND